jgi:hypothetical protein
VDLLALRNYRGLLGNEPNLSVVAVRDPVAVETTGSRWCCRARWSVAAFRYTRYCLDTVLGFHRWALRASGRSRDATVVGRVEKHVEAVQVHLV